MRIPVVKSRICWLTIMVLRSLCLFSQDKAKKIISEDESQVNSIVHTKIDVRFDFNKSYLYGKAWITLKPHFYPTDSLTLDAKGMDIKSVSIASGNTLRPVSYKYNGMQIEIKLDRIYSKNEIYTIFVDYVSKPDELKVKGSAAIHTAKGLYFINPQGKEKNKPTQIWTQGETESTSAWCPTIDRPNQKTTQEIIMTVPEKYVTLSNGLLIHRKKNGNGTRTDHWKMDQPHAPYLFFMGVGEYAIVKDYYKGKEVSYYVEKEYESVARRIFGETPEMLGFFSRITGVDYPWPKYSQMVGRYYVSGAMENTTATLHGEGAYRDARELVDGNGWEPVIAHEVFHQWFGNLVTTESWSHLNLNESFATYGEVLWDEFKYGKDAAEARILSNMNGYLSKRGFKKRPLVDFAYVDKEDMFDAVSYDKGACVLHMLRNYVGDSAFFRAINLYLTHNKFKAVETHHWRLALEEVTGKDLNWFFDQWYFSGGHPMFSIKYDYDSEKQVVIVIVTQTQEGFQDFRCPVSIDIYKGEVRRRHTVWVQNKVDTFCFPYSSKPDLVNFDGDKILLCARSENKTLENYIHQYRYVNNYLDRKEAIEFLVENQDDFKVIELLIESGMHDRYYEIRKYIIYKLRVGKKEIIRKKAEAVLTKLAASDANTTVRAIAIEKLRLLEDKRYINLILKNISDSSYKIVSSSLKALFEIDSVLAINEAKKLSKQYIKGNLLIDVYKILFKSHDKNNITIVLKNLEKMPSEQFPLLLLQHFLNYLIIIDNDQQFKKGINIVIKIRENLNSVMGWKQSLDGWLRDMILIKEGTQSVKDNISLKIEVNSIKLGLFIATGNTILF